MSQSGEKYSAEGPEYVDFVTFVEYAIEKYSVTRFDCSPGYGAAELLLSRLPESLKSRVTVTSKNLPNITRLSLRDQRVRLVSDVEATLKAYDGLPISTYFINKPDPANLSPVLFEVLAEYVRRGDIGQVGVIAHTLTNELKTFIDANAVGGVTEINVLLNLFYKDRAEAFEEYREMGIGVSSRSPLSDGIIPLISKMLPGEGETGRSASLAMKPIIDERLEFSRQLLEELEFEGDLRDLALAYVFGQQCLDNVLIGCYKNEHLDYIGLIREQNSVLDLNRIDEVVRRMRSNLSYPVQNW